jgi:rhodanese-related sulfurtransferase
MHGFFSSLPTADVTTVSARRPNDTLIDVRTSDEFALGHAPGAINIPLQELPKRTSDIPAPDGILYCMCRSGGRSASAVSFLHDMGRTDAVNVNGGMIAWEAAGLPID